MTLGGTTLLILGLVLLTISADRLVLASARLSRLWGMSPVLVGALVIGMGTSAPELLVSTLAALEGQLDLGIGNVVGSNIANVTLVLGAIALIRPIRNAAQILMREGLIMLFAVTVLAVMIWDGELTRLEGAGLIAGMALAAWLLVRWASHDAARLPQTLSNRHPPAGDLEISWQLELLVAVICLGATLAGAELLVRGASDLARALGLGSAFVGMTIVAVGTSLPELATAVAGARRRESDIVIGNIVGSNLFNALAVAGAAALIGPGAVDLSLRNASLVMVGCAGLAGLFAAHRRTVVRIEGAILLLAFFVFVALSY